jgi:hypothetical protein
MGEILPSLLFLSPSRPRSGVGFKTGCGFSILVKTLSLRPVSGFSRISGFVSITESCGRLTGAVIREPISGFGFVVAPASGFITCCWPDGFADEGRLTSTPLGTVLILNVLRPCSLEGFVALNCLAGDETCGPGEGFCLICGPEKFGVLLLVDVISLCDT